jgi:hypothetical protein
MVTVDIDSDQFALAASRYVREVGASMPKVLKAQTRLLLRDVLKFTPPKSYAQGRAAVKRDFGRAIAVLDGESFSRSPQRLREALREAITQKDIGRLNAILKSAGMPGTVVPFDASLHRRLQNSRGHVAKWSGFYTIDRRAWEARLNKLLAAVGWARAGWNAAADKVGLRMPSWVAKHQNGGGACIEIEGNIPTIEITHRSSKIPNYSRSVRDALKNRVRTMNKDVERLLNGAAKGIAYQDNTKMDIFD